MDGLQRWCRVTVLDPNGIELCCVALEGPGDPDLGTVDDLARLALVAKRLGGGIVVNDMSSALHELVDLTGLRIDVQGQTEGREESLGVQESQEERHLGDPSP